MNTVLEFSSTSVHRQRDRYRDETSSRHTDPYKSFIRLRNHYHTVSGSFYSHGLPEPLSIPVTFSNVGAAPVIFTRTDSISWI